MRYVREKRIFVRELSGKSFFQIWQTPFISGTHGNKYVGVPWPKQNQYIECCYLYISTEELYDTLNGWNNQLTSAVEACIKEPRFLLRSLYRFLISGLVFLILVCRVLDKVLL